MGLVRKFVNVFNKSAEPSVAEALEMWRLGQVGQEQTLGVLQKGSRFPLKFPSDSGNGGSSLPPPLCLKLIRYPQSERLSYINAIAIRIREHECPQTIILVLEPLDYAQPMLLANRI